MGTKALSIAGLVVALVLLFAVNILGNTVFTSARVDLTENRLFTLSEGTRSILAGLREPITIRLYLSQRVARNLPAINSYATRIKGLLGEYERASNGMVRVRIIDPEPFSEEEDRAVGYGLSGVPLDGGEEKLYMGLVGTNSIDDEDIIPFLSTSRESFIEYDITRMVYNLSAPELPVIGLLSSLPINGMGPQAALRGVTAPAWVVMEQVDELFDVQTIESDVSQIPEDVDVLLLVHPKQLSDSILCAIDQFVLGGGKATRPECGDGWFVEPTVFTGVKNSMRIAQEEVFGPVLAVIPFRDEEEALEIGNDVEFGLAAGVWTENMRRAITMSERLQAGTVWVNTYRAFSYTTPFGGYKRSGLGRENGQEAIQGYMQTKSVWISTSNEVPNPFVMR